VVVDFWAPWCGPCRVLGPLLEQLAEEYGGAFMLAKVNVDESPQLASAFGVQSIPMVVGLRDGKIASEFVGALPERQVREFLAQVLPSEAEQLAAEGAALAAAGEPDKAEAAYRRALELDARCDRHSSPGPAPRRARARRGSVAAPRAGWPRYTDQTGGGPGGGGPAYPPIGWR